ncbi:MAG: glucoamylase family protein [Phycisphaerales bacterium]
MKTLTQTLFSALISIPSVLGASGCASSQHSKSLAPDQNRPSTLHAQHVVIEPKAGIARPPFTFDAEDEELLEEIQQATFRYFIEAVSPETGMVYDRTSSDVVSVAGVGFQLAALPIGVERGWISRDKAAQHAELILNALMNEPSNRKAGLFYHFINPHDASARRVGRELVVSTVDSALLFSGMIVAGEYFRGDIKASVDQLLRDADWSFFLDKPGAGMPDTPYLSLGWKPANDAAPTGEGELLPYYWVDSGDEHRLSTLLGIAAPSQGHRVPSNVYWALRRQLGWHEGQGEIFWFPYSGALFTAFFAHLFVDYASLGTDNPQAHGMPQRARVDWWENSRRTVNLHRDRAIQNPQKLTTLGPELWGFSASDGPEGYLVSGQFPEQLPMEGAIPGRDFSTYSPLDNWGDGVIAPYAPGSSIMFEPTYAVQALRAARYAEPNHADAIWTQNWGFRDAFRLDQDGNVDWVAEDFVAISQGPLILAIENARSGLIWELFMSHPFIKDGLDRTGLD